jgi:osmoprotectant transport system permease protein
VDVYPEYTGTVAQVILHGAASTSTEEMRVMLAFQHIGMSAPIGFNDGYALAVTREAQMRYDLRRISDLARHPELRIGLSHEFLGRADGWPGLARHYGLAIKDVRGFQHALAYAALADRRIDLTDIYTTDAEIARLGLVVLEDDRRFFPRYDAVWLYRLDLQSREPGAMAAMRALRGRIDEARMMRANARVVLEKHPFQEAAQALLAEIGGASSPQPAVRRDVGSEIARRTLEHVGLVAASLAVAILIGIPIGILAAASRPLAQLTLAAAGLLQTVPSLALLALLIPLLGIGTAPALVALFLYSLLPIVRNTYVGLATIPPALSESAAAIGLSRPAQLVRVRLPLASPAIMAGIKTSAVINVGTATLAALIGAGGLGEPILSGIQLRQRGLILEGAIPAALLALAVQWGFDVLDRVAVPRGLRLPAESGSQE